jgi:D-alanyl-D-alanine carboxypeptidase
MTRLAVAWAVLLALAGCGGADNGAAVRAPGVKLTPAAAHRLDVALKEKVDDTGVPGATAAVVFADGREWSGAAGDAVLHPRRPMTTATAIPFDSITKIVTASTAMRLVEQGRLRLDDPIRRWWPAWRGDPEATVRDLLGHTSGMKDPPDAFFIRVLDHPRVTPTRRQFVAAAGKPGPRTEDAEYSNAGFVLAGLILERAGSAPIAALARRNVLSAPGGDGLALQPGERPAPPHAHSYWYPNGVGGRQADVNDRSGLLPRRSLTTMASGAIALAGDVPSLARWGNALLGGHVLEPASLESMRAWRPGTDWAGYGLGLAKWYVDDHDLWGHTGDGIGTHSELWYMPKERVTVAVAWNDDAIDNEGGIFQALVRAAVGSG